MTFSAFISVDFTFLMWKSKKKKKKKKKRSMLKTLTYLSTKVKIQNPGKLMILPVLFSSARRRTLYPQRFLPERTVG
jgi:hypothetical protein